MVLRVEKGYQIAVHFHLPQSQSLVLAQSKEVYFDGTVQHAQIN